MIAWLRNKVFRIFICLLMGSAGIFPAAPMETISAQGAIKTIFSDGFESLDQWVQEGGTSKASTSTTKYSGNQSVKFDNTDILSLSISTVGYENINLSYYYKTGSNYTGPLSVQYSVYGGTEWEDLDVIDAARGSFTKKQYALPATAGDLSDFRIRFVSGDTGTNAVYVDELEITGEEKAIVPTVPGPIPEGPETEIYTELFDDPDNFGSGGGVNVPPPWLQEGTGNSVAKTSSSTSAPSVPNMVKIDSKDSLALPLDLTGYGNIKLSYYTRASSYNSGSVMVEWSSNGGASWATLEEFKLPEGTLSQPNTRKEWLLESSANNNPNIKIRFRVGETIMGNMYIDSVIISGQRIRGIDPAPTPVPIPGPVETPPYIPPAGVKLYEDEEIGMAGNRKLYTSIAVPEAAPDAPMPVMVYIHGGGWNHGDRKQALSSISNYVIKHGYIGVSLSYRLTPEAPYPAQIQDVKLAIRYLRANAAKYHIDPSRIGVWGSSAGGHLAALLGTTADLTSNEQIALDNGNTVQVPDLEGTGGYPQYSTRVQAVVDWFGPADFTTEFANNYSSVTALLGGKKAFTVPNEARLAMPGTYASHDDPPIWIRHGKADLTIPYQDSEKLAAQLNAAGVPIVDFKLVEGQGHGFVGEAKDAADIEAWAFMDQHVKNRTVTEPILYKPGYENNNPDPGSRMTVSLNKTSFVLTPGGTEELTATISGAEMDSPTVVWTTSDNQVATVTSTGSATALVRGVAPGTAKIRVSVTEEVYAESTVIVQPQSPSDPTKVIVTEVASLTPTDDAAIDSTPANAGTNYNEKTGSSVGLFSISSSGTKQKYVYFKYDFSMVTDPSYKYTLNVSAKKGSSGTNVELSLYGLDDVSWSESDLTWNNAPVTTLNPSAMLGRFTVDSSTTKLYEVDVTDYIKSRVDKGKVAFIVGDAANTGVSLNIYSKEATGSSNPKPKLVVKQVIDYSSDMEKPVWPAESRLSASNLGMDFVDLSWPAAADNTVVTQYRIYRDDTLMAAIEGTEYKVASLTPGKAYTFTVVAVDAAGNSSLPLVLTRTLLTDPILQLPVVDVTASGSDGNPEFYTIDNNLYTRWSVAGAGQWIQFDLGAVKRIGYVGISFYKGDLRSTLIDIETSVDGTTWTRQFNGSSSGRTVHLQAFDLSDTDARYVRITGYGNSDASQFTSLTEVHMYPPFPGGDTPVAVVPNIEPGRPDEAVPFTQPGMRNADGSEHAIHHPHVTTGRTLNVLDYGADPGDNNNDDRPAIQAAIQAAVEGDEVFLPNGIYNLISTSDGLTNLTLKSGVNFRGESESGTILKTSLNQVKNSTVLKSAKQHDLVISNLTLTSTWAGEYSTDHQTNNPSAGGPDSQITIANFGEEPSYYITIDHVTVEKYIRMGIRIENSRDVVVRNSTFRNATDVGGGGAGYGVSIQGIAKTDRLGYSNDTLWNLIEDSSFEGPYLRHGVLIQFVAHNNVVRNNRFERTKLDAIDLHGELEYFNEIYGNYIADILTGAGIGLGNTGGTAPSNHSKSGHGNYIHDNIIRNSREGIVVILGTPDALIERNVIENTMLIQGGSGIHVMNGPGTIIRRNEIRNNKAPDYWGILLQHDSGDQNAGNIGEGDPHNVQILNNKITGNANGIYLQAGTDIVLRGNALDNIGVNYLKADGVTARVEEASSNADLSQLAVNIGTLNPVFAADVTNYTVNLNHAVADIELALSPANSGATLQINGTEVSTGIYSLTNLKVGETIVTIEVNAENGVKKTYTVQVNRAASSSNNDDSNNGSDDHNIGNSNNSNGGSNNINYNDSNAGRWIAEEKSVYGKQIATAHVNEQALERVLQASHNGIVKLSIATTKTPDEVSMSLSGEALSKLTTGGKVAMLVIDTQLGTYGLPIQQIHLSEWAARLGTNQDQLNLVVRITKSTDAAHLAAKEGHHVLSALEFSVMALTPDHRSLEIDEFSQYVPRTIQLESAENTDNLAVIRVSIDDSGKLVYEPLPFTINGLTVTIYSRTNSTYMVLENHASFNDIQFHWAKRDIEQLSNKLIVQGLTEEQFRPDQPITRAEFAALVIRALGLKPAAKTLNPFHDVDSKNWFHAQVSAAVEAKIISGYEDRSFRPDQPITRQEMAAISFRAMRYGGYVHKDSDGTAASFIDSGLFDAWSKEAIQQMVAQDILQGVAPGEFDPKGYATRAQSAVIINRMLSKLSFTN